MKLSTFLLLVLGLLAVSTNFFATPAYAQEDGEDDDEDSTATTKEDDADYEQPSAPVHPLTNMEGSSPDVITTYVLPGHTGSSFDIAVNKQISIVVGFVNNREADSEGNAMKVKAIGGSLNRGYDFSQYIQNFTMVAFQPQEVVDPGAEMTFEFNFKVDGATDLQSSQLALTIFYEDDNEDFTTTFFNETVMLFEKNGGFDQQMVSTYIIMIVALVAGGYYLWGVIKTQLGMKSGKSGAKKSTGTYTTEQQFLDYQDEFMDQDATQTVGKKKKEAAAKRIAEDKAKKKIQNAKKAKAKKEAERN